MKVSAHTHITNPYSSGYLAYLPSIQSFLDFADEVIVIDGGSTDDSLDRLQRLRHSSKLRIISNDLTHWGHGDKWEWQQLCIQRNTGYEECSGDWAIHFDADHILPEFEQPKLIQELERLQDQGILYGFKVKGLANTRRYLQVSGRKNWIVNKRLVAERSLRLVYGANTESDGSGTEQPINIEGEKTFVDPDNNLEKTYYVGPYVRCDDLLDVYLYKYGHFFFTYEQLCAKELRLERARARYLHTELRPLQLDNRPYELISPDEVRQRTTHPKVFDEFLASWAADEATSVFDVMGLRYYPEDERKILKQRLLQFARKLKRRIFAR